jgi:hypothetical protein
MLSDEILIESPRDIVPPRRVGRRRLALRVPTLDVADILAWADAYHERREEWPTRDSGAILEAPRETWAYVDVALRQGVRGLTGGSSLPRLLAIHRGYRNRKALPPLSEAQILCWADAHHARAGRWPASGDGPIPEAPGETWTAVAVALANGLRGMPGGSSLAKLLAAERGRPYDRDRLCYTEEEILAWADAYHARTGTWPKRNSGPVQEAIGEMWAAVDQALVHGCRGLAGGSSLLRLLAAHRGVRHRLEAPALTREGILAWADAYHARMERWPNRETGAIVEAPGETWCGVNIALRRGNRGLPSGSSLVQLLAEHRGRPPRSTFPARAEPQLAPAAIPEDLPCVSEPRAGDKEGAQPAPASEAGPDVTDTGAEEIIEPSREFEPPRRAWQWRATSRAPVLYVAKILAWADAYHERTGEWPKARSSGSIPEAPGDTWRRVDGALRQGYRGLEWGSSLAQLLAAERGVRNIAALPPLTAAQILSWADSHHARTGGWPRDVDGPIPEAPGETWSAVAQALSEGLRGWLGGSSLARLLAEERGVRNVHSLPRLSEEEILAWADVFHERTGRWPNTGSGAIEEAPEETWSIVDQALHLGSRGLQPGSSLPKLLTARRGVRNRHNAPLLTLDAILAWADAYYARTGAWPILSTEPILEAPGETWCSVNGALRAGRCGLTGPSTLARVLTEHRQRPWRAQLPRRPRLEIEQILAWADAEHARAGQWPA